MSERRKTIKIEIQGPREPLEVSIDLRDKVGYVRVRAGRPIEQTIEHSPGVYLDVDPEGLLVGFEFFLPASIEGIRDAATEYLRRESEVDEELTEAVDTAGRLIGSV